MRIAALVFIAFSLNFVYAAELFRGPMSAALGGAGAAGMPATEAAFLNPALIPLLKGSSLDLIYRDGYASAGRHRQALSLGAMDNSGDVWFPGALHYVRLRDTGRSALAADGDLWHAGIGEQIGRFTVGLSGFRLRHEVGNEAYTQWNFTLGTLFMIHENLGVAYVLKNIAQPGSDVPMGLREDMAQTIGVFAGLGEVARLRVDVSRQERFNPDHKMAYMVGLESKNSEFLLFRFGYRYDDLAGQRVWTAGLGFDGPRLKADYSMEKDQYGTPGALHSVDLRLVF